MVLVLAGWLAGRWSVQRRGFKCGVESLQITEADEQQIRSMYYVLWVFSINMLNSGAFVGRWEFPGRNSLFVRKFSFKIKLE